MAEKVKDQGLTIVPVKLFINDKGFAKLNIALAKGKNLMTSVMILKSETLNVS